MKIGFIPFILLILNFPFNHAAIGLEKDLGDVVLTTALGKLRGTYLTSQSGRNFYAFRGIRYAKPPIGDLRFKAPEAIDHWNGVFDATADGPMCPQLTLNSTDISEDCLRLNIYSHELQSSDGSVKKPVIVYLHPGGFYALSGQSRNFAGPQYFMDRSIVLVTLNYRLGALGFLSTGTLDASGNAGLKDQAMALKWIKLHISKFGGDPASVTLLGYGAGAIATSLHMISPMSKGLFHKAILMSGAATAQWKISGHQLTLARKQGMLLNCTQDNISEMMKCLRTKHEYEFANTQSSLFEFGLNNPFLLWRPVIEPDLGQERFLTEDPTKLYQNGRFMRIPVIVGMTEKEFVGPAVGILQNETLRNKLDNNFDEIAPICLMYERHTPKSKQISKQLRRYYLGSGSLHSERSVDGLSQMFADALVGFGVHRFVHLTARLIRVYYYKFTYQGKFSHLYYPHDKPYGVVHHDDLQYLFIQPSISKMFTDEDSEHRIVEKMTRMWTAFANRGDPNKLNDEYLREIRWRPFNYRREVYLDIGDEVEMDSFLNTERYEFWKNLFPIDWLNRRKPNELNIEGIEN